MCFSSYLSSLHLSRLILKPLSLSLSFRRSFSLSHLRKRFQSGLVRLKNECSDNKIKGQRVRARSNEGRSLKVNVKAPVKGHSDKKSKEEALWSFVYKVDW